MKVFISGATGNVGTEVIKSLQTMNHALEIYVGVRNITEDSIKLADYKVNFLLFDFTDVKTFSTALTGMDIVFLLRPPQISEVQKYFKPIIETCKEKGVGHIVFLSVQGADKNTIIPHHKIEKLIVDSKIPYTFLRPAYFMQNFISTLRADLVHKKLIYLPAGNAKFTLIDVRDIGLVSAIILTTTSQHLNKCYDLTSKEKLTFYEMAEALSKILGIAIRFESPDLIRFYLTKRKEKIPAMLILVMIMLHYFPRFQKEPNNSEWVEKITHKQPITFQQFIHGHKKELTLKAS